MDLVAEDKAKQNVEASYGEEKECGNKGEGGNVVREHCCTKAMSIILLVVI